MDSDHVTRLRAGACEVGVGVVRDNGGVGVVRDNGGVCGRQCLHGGHRGARVVLACAVAASSGSVGDGSERSGPGEIGVAAVVGGDEQFVPVRAR